MSPITPRRALRRGWAAGLAVATALTVAGVGAPAAVAAPDPGTAVKVNQVAYVPGVAKVATLVSSSTTPVAWTLRDAAGRTVAEGTTTVQGADALSSDRTHRVDFSAYDTPGTGYVLSAGGASSLPFDISADPLERLKADSLAFFYHQRSGIAIESRYVGSTYARAAGHLGVAPNQGDTSVPCRTSCGYSLDVRGGWYDAGDHGKYVVNGGIATWQLQNAYERTLHVAGADRAALGDGTAAIPEQANGVPDVLDEARWELEFLLRMQVPAGRTDAGMVHHKMHDENWTGIPTIPAQDAQRRVLAPVSTAATLNMAAVAAQASRLWATYDPAFSTRALAAARTAYAAAKANPNRIASDTDGTGGGAYGDKTVTDEFYWAAAELYATTGEAGYRADVTGSSFYRGTSFTERGYDWGWTGGLGDTTLALVPTGLPAADVTATRSAIVRFADAALARLATQAYPAPNNAGNVYYWGSNGQVANNANVLALAYDFTGQAKYRTAVFGALDYFQGRNPLNQSYVAGYGEKAVRNVHHRFWANQADASLPTAPPGSFSGGPNSELQDPLAASQLAGCAAQKCFVDHIEAYSVNEVAINWNSALVWLTAWAAEQAGGTTPTPTPTPTPTVTPTPTPTVTPTPTPSPTVTPTPTPTPTSSAACKVTYTASSWTSGFTAAVTVTNTGSTAWSSWRLGFTFPGDQQVTQGWSATWAQTGTAVTATSAAWNGALAPGGSTTIGFNGSYSGTNAAPTAFTVNGSTCS